ncbi:MAG: APC family permease [Pseudomonadota bacterium]
MSATEPTLKRRLGFGLLTLYGVGVMIGAGIYVLVGQVAGQTGEWAPATFLLAGLIAAPTALVYADLSSRIPESAGEAAYVRAASGSDAIAALVGLAVAAVGVISAGAVLQGGAGYLVSVVPIPRELAIIAAGLLLTGAAILGVIESLAFAAVLTVIELIGLLLVIAVGLGGEGLAANPVEGVGLSAIAAASILAFFAFIGFEDMVNMVEETKDPARTMPRAIIAALLLTTLIYVLVAWAASRTVPAAELGASDKPLALVFETATGQGAAFLSLIAVAAALNGVLAQIVMSARVLFGLGRFAPAFRVFHRAHPRFGTPVLGTLIPAALTILLALTAPLATLAEITSLVLLAVFVAINAALIVLRRRDPSHGWVPTWVPWFGGLLSLAAFGWGVLS